MAVRAIGVNHVAFEVEDLDATLEWYERYFEFELRGRRGGRITVESSPGAGTTIIAELPLDNNAT